MTKAIKDPTGGRQRTILARKQFIARHDVARVEERMVALYQSALDGPVVPHRR